MWTSQMPTSVIFFKKVFARIPLYKAKIPLRESPREKVWDVVVKARNILSLFEERGESHSPIHLMDPEPKPTVLSNKEEGVLSVEIS
mmetsp:Transcript_7432/g.15160  ORF Transcript_7432/g.15160 Transcript_7432/m.15160 type:complete len:87 (-) Transcript_7432:1040-1300(-)